MSVDATPVATFVPERLHMNSIPLSSKTSSIMFETVVLPFVPVMPMIFFGFGMRPIKSGHRIIAQEPGMDVPFLPMSFKTSAVPRANISAK